MSAPSAPGGGYAPYAPYPPMEDKSGGGYPPSYSPAGPHDGGMGYPPGPGQAPYPPGAGQAPYPPGAGQAPYPPGPPMGAYQAPSPYPPAQGMMMSQPQQYAPAQPYGAYQAPVMVQPGAHGQPPPQVAPTGAPQAGGWMTIPQGIPNCPPGLEYLSSIDQLLVHQKVELLEAFTGFETANKYTVKNTLGQKVYWAVEDTDCCTRNCCGPARPFDMKVLDYYQNEVLHFNRPLRCSSCCFPCCLQTLEVSAPPGNVIGTVEQNWSILTPQFSIKDQSGSTVLRVEGPFCTFSICGDVEFKVVANDGTQVGKISKQWSGFAREAFTDSDHFGINFPMDLDVRVKATLMGCLFLIHPPRYPYWDDAVSKQPASQAVLHQQQQQPLLPAHPVGLEYLLDTGTIRFKQEIHVTQIICGCDMPIEFDLINENDQIIYQLQERENLCLRNCVPQGFRTQSVVSKTSNAPVLCFKREARCVFNCCLPCCCFPLPFSRERLSVYGDSGDRLLGVVQQDFSAWRSRFSILDAAGNAVLRIEGPGSNFSCFGDIEFQIVSLDGTPVGSIEKHFTGVIRETFSDFDNFTIDFPRDMDVGTKATLLGAVSLINFLFFQGASRRLIRDISLFCSLNTSAV